MISRRIAEHVLLGAIGIAFWLLVCGLSGAREPWDAEGYWTMAYPASIVLAGLIGLRFGRHGWVVGLVLTLAQLPVMLALAGIAPMSIFALLLLGVLAVPAMLASAAAGWMGGRAWRC